MSFLKKTIRIVKKANKIRKKRHADAVREARKVAKAQETIRKGMRRKAGDIVAEGGFEWEGNGLAPDTMMEPQMGPNGWEWVPVQSKPRTTAQKTGQRAPICGATTKDGKKCQRRGDCPIPAHRKAK